MVILVMEVPATRDTAGLVIPVMEGQATQAMAVPGTVRTAVTPGIQGEAVIHPYQDIVVIRLRPDTPAIVLLRGTQVTAG